MRLTDEIVRALQGTIENGYESVADFARQANVSGNTITKCLRKETAYITDESWRKIHPLIRHVLPRSRKADDSHHRPEDLCTDQKIMLDTFGEFPKDVKKKALSELVDLVKTQQPDFVPPATVDNKLLLIAFDLLPKDLQKQKTLEFVAMAKDQVVLQRMRSASAKA